MMHVMIEKMKHFQMRQIKIVSNRDILFIKKVISYHTIYGRHTLPWRKNISPYKILVSEIMLQQTQVSRVLPKFLLWMKKYPSLQSLRRASLKDILVLWQGLGYQRRAKALYTIAQSHVRIPHTFEALCELPGIGKYTASAVCAFAYNTFTYPMLETNIRTALIEEFHMEKEKIHDGILYDTLDRLTKNKHVQKIGARAWYFALMDYGAHLKEQHISHNAKSTHYVKQSPYKGSIRELRAKILFAITHTQEVPKDIRTQKVLEQLIKEGYVIQKRNSYIIS